MPSIGFWELTILALIGLVVLGPEKLPRVANQIGNWLGQARRMTRMMKRQLEEEMDFSEKSKIEPPTPDREPSTKKDFATPRDDDDFSPAHAEDDVGTGVGIGDDEEVGEDAVEPEIRQEDDIVEPVVEKETDKNPAS